MWKYLALFSQSSPQSQHFPKWQWVQNNSIHVSPTMDFTHFWWVMKPQNFHIFFSLMQQNHKIKFNFENNPVINFTSLPFSISPCNLSLFCSTLKKIYQQMNLNLVFYFLVVFPQVCPSVDLFRNLWPFFLPMKTGGVGWCQLVHKITATQTQTHIESQFLTKHKAQAQANKHTTKTTTNIWFLLHL